MSAFLLAFAAASAAQSVPPEPRCDVLVRAENGKARVERTPDLRILEGTAAEGPFRPPLPAGAAAIFCERGTIVPGEHDDEVVAGLGLPLYITDLPARGDASRAAVLEVSGGQFRYRMVVGQLDPEEREPVSARLRLFQDRAQRER